MEAMHRWVPTVSARLLLTGLLFLFSATTTFAASPLEAAGGGAVRALVIGIDNYRNVHVAPPLDGAVADARDLATALRTGYVKDLTMLVDHEATRSAVEMALAGLAQRAQPRDLVLVTFAGHGAREPERTKGSEPDQLDEVFLLWGFDTSGQGTLERIIDDEMNVWLGRIAKTGAHILFLTDSCFGGGLTKAVDPRVSGLKTRGLKRVGRPELVRSGTYYIDPGQDRLVPGGIPADDNATNQHPSLTFIAAVDDEHESPEVQIAGESTPRGAASYALARALEGTADREGDQNGVTTRRELFAYLRRNVQILSANRQSPVAEPRTPSSAETALFRTPRSTNEMSAIAQKPFPPVKVVEAKAGAPPNRPDIGAIQVTWDPRNGDVIDLAGAVVAFGVRRDALPAVIERFTAVRQLASLARGRAADMTVSPPDRDFRSGERFDITIDGLYGRYL
ncbi:MAG: caspase family protein, partial [Rhodospirillales bacterium]|nr:caspase family protein [Rhodospirillales bacterium]